MEFDDRYLPPAKKVWGNVIFSQVWTETSLDRDPLHQRTPPPDRDPTCGKEWVVRILLECILVKFSVKFQSNDKPLLSSSVTRCMTMRGRVQGL